jgi:hypothetical protein
MVTASAAEKEKDLNEYYVDVNGFGRVLSWFGPLYDDETGVDLLQSVRGLTFLTQSIHTHNIVCSSSPPG